MAAKKRAAKPATAETKSYHVSIPIAGSATLTVEAVDEESAKAAAWEAIDNGAEADVTWEYHEQIASGNCLHVSQNEIEVSEA